MSHYSQLIALIALLLIHGSLKAHPAEGIVIDSNSNLYFADIYHNTVWRYRTDGSLERAITNKHVHSLAIDEADNLYAWHTNYDAAQNLHGGGLWQLTTDQQLIKLGYSVSNGFDPEYAPHVDALGRRYSWQGNNHERDSSQLVRWYKGQIEILAGSSWGKQDGTALQSKLGSVGGLQVNPEGEIFFSDDNCVRKLTTSLQLLTYGCGDLLDKPWYAWGFGNSNHLRGVTYDAADNIYVANSATGDVIKVNPQGKQETYVEADFGWSAIGVAWHQGVLYVLRENRHQLAVSKIPALAQQVELVSIAK